MQQQEQAWQAQQPESETAQGASATGFASEPFNRRASFWYRLKRRGEQGQSAQPRQEPFGAEAEPLHDYSYWRGYPAQDYPLREEEEQPPTNSVLSGSAASPNESVGSWSTAASAPAGAHRYSGPDPALPATPGPGRFQYAPSSVHVDPSWSQPPWWARPQPQSSRGRLITWTLLALALLTLLPGGVGLLLGLLGATVGLMIAALVIALFCVLPLAIGGAIVWLLVHANQRGWLRRPGPGNL